MAVDLFSDPRFNAMMSMMSTDEQYYFTFNLIKQYYGFPTAARFLGDFYYHNEVQRFMEVIDAPIDAPPICINVETLMDALTTYYSAQPTTADLNTPSDVVGVLPQTFLSPVSTSSDVQNDTENELVKTLACNETLESSILPTNSAPDTGVSNSVTNSDSVTPDSVPKCSFDPALLDPVLNGLSVRYECNACKKIYKRTDGVRKHFKKAHGNIARGNVKSFATQIFQ
jgi:hypothetical protein